MRTLVLILFVSLLFVSTSATTVLAKEDSDQTISDFNLAGFGEQGERSWELSGKSADIFTENVKLNDVVGKFYGEDEDVVLTADKGNFDKVKGNVHLEENVVIATSSGTELTTDSLDWDRTNQRVTTQELVNIKRDNMIARALGAAGEPSLKIVSLQREVELEVDTALDKIDSKKSSEQKKIVITCDGPLEIDYQKNIAMFYNNVKVDQTDIEIYSDRMDAYFSTGSQSQKIAKNQISQDLMGGQISKVVAKGNVKIVRGDNISYSNQAVYDARDRKIILTGRPQLIIYSSEGLDASIGN